MGFKFVANARDLRDVQMYVLWEWAVSTGEDLPSCAARFEREYRSFWPLAQLGDPRQPEDRTFACDKATVLAILRRLEDQFGSNPGASDPRACRFHPGQLSPLGQGLVWVRNTSGPRAQSGAYTFHP